MRNEDYISKVYRSFSEFILECSSRELEYFIFDAKFTTMFNKRIGELIEDIKSEGKKSVELSIIFNTDGEIALIDSYIIGRYISNNYDMHMEQYYRETSLNNIVSHVVNSNKKSKRDFLILSYNIIYSALNSIYSDIKFKKDTLEGYINAYSLKHCVGDDCALVVVTILILEDICKFLRIDEEILDEAICDIGQKRSSQNS